MWGWIVDDAQSGARNFGCSSLVGTSGGGGQDVGEVAGLVNLLVFLGQVERPVVVPGIVGA